MSAYIVDNRTIDRAVSLWMTDAYGQCPSQDQMPNCESADQLGRDMLTLNRQAVMERYTNSEEMGLPTDEEIAAYRYPLKHVERIQALKSLQCLTYQCAEGKAIESALFERMQRKTRQTAEWIVSQLPEYEAADWG